MHEQRHHDSSARHTPPRLATMLLHAVLERGIVCESIVGDLREEFQERAERLTLSAARLWYWRETLGIVIRLRRHGRFRHRPTHLHHHDRDARARSARGGDPFMHSVLKDIRYAVRGFRKTPGFALVAVFTIALGVGANTAMFSVVNGVLLKPLSYQDPDGIVRVWPEKVFNIQMLQELAERTNAFDALSAYRHIEYTLTGAGSPQVLAGALVSASHFSVLGVQPIIGRGFIADDEIPGAQPVVVLSHGSWTTLFGGDATIIGKTITLGGAGHESRTVIGVMPARHMPLSPEWQAWAPFTVDRTASSFGAPYGYRAVGRLAADVSIEQARSQLRALVSEFREEHPTQFRPGRLSPIAVQPLREVMVGSVRPTLFLLLGSVGFVLLIACSNVGSLLLARSGVREREVALRMALGAERRRVVRQLLTESGVLGLGGGLVGLVAAIGLLAALSSKLPGVVPRAGEVGIDMAVVGFTVTVSLVAALLFGTVPAFRATGAGASAVLVEGGRSATVGKRRHRLNGALVAAEVALSVVLVVGAGLLLKSFWRMQQVDVGFDRSNLLTLQVTPPPGRYADANELNTFLRSVVDEISAVPGVTGVGVINRLPMTGGNIGFPYLIEGEPLPAGTVSQVINLRVVTPEYFETMTIPHISGRPLGSLDREDTEDVGLVNQAMVRRHWPGEDPVGKRLTLPDGTPVLAVVGVVGDVHQHELALEAEPEVYLPGTQGGWSNPFIVVRHTPQQPNIAPAVRAALQSVDSDVPLTNLRAMDAVIGQSLGDSRFFTSLFASFAALALVLATIGVYGVMSYTTKQRTKEIGLRVALGAAPTAVVRSVVANAMAPVLLGILAGVVAAFAVTRLLGSMLFEVGATDPTTFITVSVLIGIVSLAASMLPAREAATVDPVIALRTD